MLNAVAYNKDVPSLARKLEEVPSSMINICSVVSRSEVAENKSDWMTKTFFGRISLNTQCP
jgi:hypothetical protein